MDEIIIRGACQNNLKNIDVRLPRNKLIVITGVSGSGKSSLAFDTLYAEAHRRFLEALSTYGRHFFQKLDAPQVSEIQGLSPAIAIQQRRLPLDPRATVGTITEIMDHLRLLYAKLGTLFCPACRRPVKAYTIPEMVRELFDKWDEGVRLLLLAPVGPVREKELPQTLKRLRREGFARVRVDGAIHELESHQPFPRRPLYHMDIVVDRVILNVGKSRRLSESLELGLKVGKGTVGVSDLEGVEKIFSETFTCAPCGLRMLSPSPSTLSFRHPSGMCEACKGMGFLLPAVDGRGGRRREEFPEPRETMDGWGVLDLSYIPEEAICGQCHGTRLNETARSVALGGLGIHEVARLSVPSVRTWLETLRLQPAEEAIADRPREEILQRLRNLEELGLEYLSLDRSAFSLSGGEVQRIRLAQQLSGSLSGVLYILDEPSVGLHPADHDRLLRLLCRLRDRGNTVVVVEHDRETVLRADFVVDMGPGAGSQGGEVLFAGSPKRLMKEKKNLTGMYLSGKMSLGVGAKRRVHRDAMLSIIGARGHNLKGIDAHIPLGALTCVTGVSGSGKTTLVLHTLYRALAGKLFGSKLQPAPFQELRNAESVGKVVLVDQSPVGRTSRSTPATYTGIFLQIRELFAQIPESRARGYGASRFSFNVKGGRCETCKGEGVQRVEMLFLPDVLIQCPACTGSRYNEQTLEIKFKGRPMDDVLRMTAQEALGVFGNVPSIRHRLETLVEVGLGYIRLGQPGPTLSGGEAQRVKLAAELSRRSSLKTLYILDEPTTGLHLDDIHKLLHLLQRLVDRGQTVVLIEHHPEVIQAADHVIDLGPEGGEKGGYIVAEGAPEEIAKQEKSLTGRYLRTIVNA